MKAHDAHAHLNGRHSVFERGHEAADATNQYGILLDSNVASTAADRIDINSYLAADLDAVSRAAIIPVLLRSVSDMAGLRLAAIVRTSDGSEIVCAVEDRITRCSEPGHARHGPRTHLNGKRPATAQSLLDAVETPQDDVIDHGDTCLRTPIVLPCGRIFGMLTCLTSSASVITNADTHALLDLHAGQIALAIDHEIRQERRHDEQLKADAAAELTEQFVAILGHDLRNPLQAISVLGELLERLLSDPGHVNLVSRLRQSTRRMSALIDDILDFARVRLGSGLGMVMKEIQNLDEALLEVTRELQDGHPHRHIATSVDIRRAVNCDAGRLQQLVSNLLSNALSHGYPHSIVRFTATADDSYLALEVWNDGEPIPPESIDQLFMPFWRNKTASHRTGLGLGLHICDQIIRAHHGVVSVISTSDSGTKFTVRLPLGIHSTAASMQRFA